MVLFAFVITSQEDAMSLKVESLRIRSIEGIDRDFS